MDCDVSGALECESAALCGENDASAAECTAELAVTSHHVVMETVRDRLDEAVAADRLLSDLPSGVTLQEVKSLIALEYGQAMTVYLNRGDKKTGVIVSQSDSVGQLKKAIQLTISLELKRSGRLTPKQLNWRYVWRSNWLCFGGKQLKDDREKLCDLGVRHKSEIRFVKRYRYKRGQKKRRTESDS